MIGAVLVFKEVGTDEGDVVREGGVIAIDLVAVYQAYLASCIPLEEREAGLTGTHDFFEFLTVLLEKLHYRHE